MGFYNALSGLGSRANPAVTTFYDAWRSKPVILPIDPWMAGMVETFPGAKLITEVPISIHSGRLRPWRGQWEFGGRSSGMLRVSRGAMTIGAHATIIGPMSEIDFTGWNVQPDSISTTIGNQPPLAFAYMLNGAYSGSAKDENGGVPEIEAIAPCIDQIYGGAPAAPSANVNTIAIASNGTLKPANPADPSVLGPGGAAGWYNCHPNHDGGNPQAYISVFENMNARPAHNGVPMMLAANKRNMRMLVSPLRFERNNILFTVMKELALSGAAAQVEYTPTGGSPIVVFGNAPNPTFGRLVIEAVPGLRDDLRVIVGEVPPQFPQLVSFMYAHGGTIGQYKVQESASDPTNNSVPHIYVQAFDTNSPLYAGVMGLPAGTIGMGWIINEGYAWASGWQCEFLFDGSAS